MINYGYILNHILKLGSSLIPLISTLQKGQTLFSDKYWNKQFLHNECPQGNKCVSMTESAHIEHKFFSILFPFLVISLSLLISIDFKVSCSGTIFSKFSINFSKNL